MATSTEGGLCRWSKEIHLLHSFLWVIGIEKLGSRTFYGEILELVVLFQCGGGLLLCLLLRLRVAGSGGLIGRFTCRGGHLFAVKLRGEKSCQCFATAMCGSNGILWGHYADVLWCEKLQAFELSVVR